LRENLNADLCGQRFCAQLDGLGLVAGGDRDAPRYDGGGGEGGVDRLGRLRLALGGLAGARHGVGSALDGGRVAADVALRSQLDPPWARLGALALDGSDGGQVELDVAPTFAGGLGHTGLALELHLAGFGVQARGFALMA
jgi:hypothetical protein